MGQQYEQIVIRMQDHFVTGRSVIPDYTTDAMVPPSEIKADRRAWHTWSERVRLLLEQEGMSQAELGRRVGLQEATFQRYLGRAFSQPDFDVLLSVCRALRTHPNYLLGYSDDPREPPNHSRVQRLEEKLEQLERRLDKKPLK